MSQSWGWRAVMDGEECLYCHVVFGIFEAHPESVELINGYPAPCRNMGRQIFGLRTEDETPWHKTHVKYEPVLLDDNNPLWMQ